MNRFNNQNLIDHIRNKISSSDPYFEDFYTLSDQTIEKILTTTFVFIKDRINSCIYCKNHKRFGFSQCKIHNHLQDNCFYNEPDRYIRLPRKTPQT